MDLRELKEMMDLLEKSDLHKLSIKKKGIEICLEKPPKEVAAPVVHHAAPMPHMAPPASAPAPAAKAPEEKPGDFITSPMVGTYYASPSPTDPPFVKVGDTIDASTVVCIIEAMKVMNEVKAGKSGTVREILVDNASPVEFGTKILRIE